MVEGGDSGASWGLPALRPAWAVGDTPLLGTSRDQTPWEFRHLVVSSTEWCLAKGLHRVKDSGTKLRAGGSWDAVDFASRFGRERQHVWELQVGGCSLRVVRGRSYMKGGINWECGCSTGSGKLFGARLRPFHSIKARALR